MIRAAILSLALAGCATEDDAISPQPVPTAMAAACCQCNAAPYIYEPGSISEGFPVTIPTDTSGGCSSYEKQAGNVGLGNHMSYQTDGIHDCFSVPMPSGGCPNTWTPKQTQAQSSSTTAD